MDIQEEIAAMQERIFTKELLDQLLLAYHQETWQEKCTSIEDDYVTGKAALADCLNETQQAVLADLEASASHNLERAMRFGLSRGVYAGFQTAFLWNAREDPFETLVVDEILKMPNMQRYTSYFSEREHMGRLHDLLFAQLDANGQEYLTSIICAWDERLYGVLRHAFQMGRRAAQDLLREIHHTPK